MRKDLIWDVRGMYADITRISRGMYAGCTRDITRISRGYHAGYRKDKYGYRKDIVRISYKWPDFKSRTPEVRSRWPVGTWGGVQRGEERQVPWYTLAAYVRNATQTHFESGANGLQRLHRPPLGFHAGPAGIS